MNQIELDLYRTLPTHKRYKADGEWVCSSITCVSYYHSCVVLSKKYYIMHCCVSNYRLICVYTYIHIWYVAQFQNMSVSLILFQINKLRRVLVAFSWYDTSIGYCQGLNRLAAIALLFLDEEHAFWCLVTIVHHHLPQDYYDRSLLGSQADQVLNFQHTLPVHLHSLLYCSVF